MKFRRPPAAALVVLITFAASSLMVVGGCSRSTEIAKAEFEPNLVHAMKYQIKEGIPMEQASDDTFWLIDQFFGTPDEPKIPEVLQDEDFEGLISRERLQKASGPEDAEGRGLYRKHCISCHGVTGNGRGELSAVSDPYPRDYRAGIFKYKSTERGSKPLREDLANSIRHGIAGTTMKVIPELSEEDIQALVDYVIYLSLRGELERSLIDEAIFEGLLEDGLRIVNRELGERVLAGEREKIKEEFAAWESADEPEDDPRAELDLELYDESIEIAEDILADIADEWFEAEDDVVDVPEPPAEILVADDYEQFLALKEGDQAETLASSVERGRELFTGKVASCSKCHGEQGKGDGQNKDYDDWTKDWTSRVGLDPTDFDSLVPLMARGAMPPKNARPRNLSEGIFRGGESAESLYRRIIQGIDGSPMPSSTFVPGKYEEDDIWHIINFIRSLRTTPVENG